MRTAILTTYAKNFINLLYPLYCSVCATPLDPLVRYRVCERCISSIRRNPKPWCIRCGRSVVYTDTVCKDCARTSFWFRRIVSCFLYEGVMRKCIHRVKYDKKIGLLKMLGHFVADFAGQEQYLFKGVDMITFVPLHPAKARERGFNQSKAIAHSVSERLGIPLIDILEKTRSTRPQSELSKEERARNLSGAFRIRRDRSPYRKTVLIVDDVFTTGSTLNECSRVLRDAGARAVDALTLTRGL